MAASSCALDLADTAGVVRIEALARLPGVTDELAGVVAEQGRIWPVFDLARLLGLTPDPAELGFAILLRRGGRRCALGVAALDGLRDIPPPAPDVAPARYVRAVTDDAIVIDADQVLGHPLLRKEDRT